jgi:hypothetical protein
MEAELLEKKKLSDSSSEGESDDEGGAGAGAGAGAGGRGKKRTRQDAPTDDPCEGARPRGKRPHDAVGYRNGYWIKADGSSHMSKKQ